MKTSSLAVAAAVILSACGGSSGPPPRVNTAPAVINPGSLSGVEGEAVALGIAASDADGDTLRYLASGLPPGLAIDAGSGSISGNFGTWGAFNVTVTVTDGTDSARTSFSWNVAERPNAPPAAMARSVFTNFATPLPITLAGTDADADLLTFDVTAPPAFGAISGTAPNLTYTPGAGFSGTDSVSFTVFDGRVASAPAAITIVVRPASGARPNILLIVTDDIGLDTTSAMHPGLIDGLAAQYGSSGHDHPQSWRIAGRPASTPTLSALARHGMAFTQIWVQPYCSPTRASFLTGLYAARTRVLDYTSPLSQNHRTFVHSLKDQGGYSTAIFGKWHVAGLGQYPGMKPKQAGFELFLGNLDGAIDTYWSYAYHVQDGGTPLGQWRTEAPPVRSLPGIASTTYAPVVKAADAIAWITAREAADPARPWFAWLAFNLAHITSAPTRTIVPNADTLDDVSRAEMQACGGTFGTASIGSCSAAALNRAMTNSLDTVVGTLLDAVAALDPYTYVIVVGDNGTPMYGSPAINFIDNLYITRSGRAKGTAYESGVRVSLAIKGPGIAAGGVSHATVHGVDLFATILELAGLAVPATVPNRTGTGVVPLDSLSLAPILFGAAAGVRDPSSGYVMSESINPLANSARQAAARNATYKVLCEEDTLADTCTFFDLVDDPLEEYPLAKPGSCTGYDNATWTPADRDWHFCRLLTVLRTESFL